MEKAINRIKKSMVGTLLLLGFGCLVLSIHPLYDEKTLVEAPEILGVWAPVKEAKADEIWQFRSAGKFANDFIFTDGDGLRGTFKAHVVQLGEHRFLDLYPEAETLSGKTAGVYSWHLIAAHTFYRVWVADDKLHLSPLDLKWVEDGVRSGGIQIDHLWADGQIVLTADTKTLQRFVVENVDEAFSDADILRRLETQPGNRE